MKRLFSIVSIGLLTGIAVVSMTAHADSRKKKVETVRAWLSGYEEVQGATQTSGAIGAVSSAGRGFFRAVIDEDAGTIEYSYTYDGVANITQSHLHFGQHHTQGGITVFLCTNLAPPANVPVPQPCPASPGQITGTITAQNVIATAGLNGFDKLLDAIRHEAVYVNLHSQAFPGGEIRGQLQH
ncbi:MAG TPA: CHRD domain-containing protein [Gammaproteobacteria bacterium]|nr:CHRD domain-containing protein [Gammaproteobacteria bacterium]